ncbi:alpha/beta-hydrolase [Irpex rosettiformis]|uniref:Alpha/beta-hydrolase n=1 Tax=Irpex rosettiformis TaxID=378272 RepID=A0ACB8TWL1_9APHY|nr:alpha/beta-hydrolase [Irpex rosettiformis]
MDPLTFTYKQVDNVDLAFDLYHPPNPTTRPLPIVINFHGGGLTVGNTKSWFPAWLKDRVISAGFIFLSANYRLIPPSTGHDIVEDIRDLFRFVAEDLTSQLRDSNHPVQIDVNAIAVSGCSAGGLCAYLSVMHVHPRPKAVVALYAMGGNLLTPQYIRPKTEIFLRGREILDPTTYSDFLYPQSLKLLPTADSALAYHGTNAPIPGFPANPRMLLNRLYLQLGTYLDYYTGAHETSLSAKLLEAAEGGSDNSDSNYSIDNLKPLIPSSHLPLFPQFAVDSSWPPTFLVHGSADTAVKLDESIHMHRLLTDADVTTVLKVVEGAEHSLDYVSDANEKYGKAGGLFDEIGMFLVDRLRQA